MSEHKFSCLCHHTVFSVYAASAHNLSMMSIRSVSGTMVTVFDNASLANANDWIGMYLASDDALSVAPIEYQMCNFDSNYLAHGTSQACLVAAAGACSLPFHPVKFQKYAGYGSLSVRVLNMRDDVVFYYFTNGLITPTIASVSNTLTLTNPNQPTQVRISLSNVYAQLRITWTTKNSCVASFVGVAAVIVVVILWVVVGSLNSVASYKVFLLCNQDAACGRVRIAVWQVREHGACPGHVNIQRLQHVRCSCHDCGFVLRNFCCALLICCFWYFVVCLFVCFFKKKNARRTSSCSSMNYFNFRLQCTLFCICGAIPYQPC
jgi:hypothetical protein